ncbi:MAG: GTP-binding protein [Holophagaceae bacterium]
MSLDATLDPLPPLPRAEDLGVLRFMTCGSVDDGKSTLIGRLLYDSRAILADALEALESTSRRRGHAGIDLSLLTDGLAAEREQGITIDVAYRYFATATRKFIIADAPGHEQYTRNMVTAASTADLALILVDAARGVRPQTLRHAALAHLLGVRHLVFAVNKLDAVGYDPAVFRALVDDLGRTCAGLGIADPRFVPCSALAGDMVVRRGSRLPWYEGPTLLEVLASADIDRVAPDRPFRFPVQLVGRPLPGLAPRRYLGRIASGSVAPGDAVAALPGGRSATVARIRLLDTDLPRAVAGQSVSLELAEELDLARGDLLASAVSPPRPTRRVEATLCWLADRPWDAARPMVLRHTTREVRARLTAIEGRLDLGSGALAPASGLGMNDIAVARLELQQPIFADPYALDRAGGAFLLRDAATHLPLAAGLLRTLEEDDA